MRPLPFPPHPGGKQNFPAQTHILFFQIPDLDEDYADINVPAANRPGKPGFHITRPTQVPAYCSAARRTSETLPYQWYIEFKIGIAKF